MRLTRQAYQKWPAKAVTLLGMSGVGKTYLSTKLCRANWFHYSCDYRIGTRYLDEAILDMVKAQAMQVPFLRDLLRRDWIYLANNIRVDDLGPVLSFVGKLGDPELSGVPLALFQQRQALYRESEIQALYDVPSFIDKAQKIYGYDHFINDVGGSLCDLNSPQIIEKLAEHSVILYIAISDVDQEHSLIQRALTSPKPLYYPPDFLTARIPEFLDEQQLEYIAQANPDEFLRWIFPRLYQARKPRYETIAKEYGYTVDAKLIANVRDEYDFNALMCDVLGDE